MIILTSKSLVRVDEHLDDASNKEHLGKDGSDEEESPEDQMGLEEAGNEVFEVEDMIMLPGTAAAKSVNEQDIFIRKGSGFSKFAPMSTSLAMKVDSPADMLSMTKVNLNTQRKLEAFQFKKQNPEGAMGTGSVGDEASGLTGGKTNGVGVKMISKSDKTGIKRPTTTKNARGAQ